MKKFIKWLLIIMVASILLGVIINLFQSDEDKTVYEVKSKAELLDKAKTLNELTSIYSQLDSIYAVSKFESVKTQIDLLRKQKPDFEKKIEAEFEENLKYEAYQVAKEYIMQRLKSPSTAKFASVSDAVLFKDDKGIYNLALEVDAQNSFGAMLREKYFIQIGVVGGKVVALGSIN